MDIQHSRAWSQSTTATWSPTSSQDTGDKHRDRVNHRPPKIISPRLRILQQQTKGHASPLRNIIGAGKPVRRKKAEDQPPSLNGRPRPSGNLKGRTKTSNPAVSATLSKTPALGLWKTESSRKAEAKLYRSPGGSDYIVTPGRHLISMTEFLSTFDAKNASATNPPALRGAAHYAQRMHHEWMLREKRIDSEVFLLSFADDCPMEHFRQMAIQTVFNYAVEHKLHEKTVHLTVLNISRLVHARVMMQSKEKSLTHELFACTVMAALRNAIKNDESYEKADRFRLEPEHVWRLSPFLANFCPNKSAKRLNEVESESLKILDDPSNPPLAPDFFERYLEVGAWPSCMEQYKELGSFLMGLGLFSCGTENPLRRVPGSRLAAASLVLAVKVVNTDNNNVKYEFWPERLQAYTGFTLETLKPAIRGLASLLRNKPRCSSILEKYYTKWSEYDWN